MMKRERCALDNPLAKSLLVNGLVHCPHLSSAGAEVLIPSILASFFVQIDFMVNPEAIAAISPKAAAISHLIRNESVNLCLDVRREVRS